jgi:hypothetical protein
VARRRGQRSPGRETPAALRAPVGKPVVQGAPDFTVWFVKKSNQGVYEFGVEAVGMRDPLVFVPAMARAVAHAWLVEHGVKVPDTVPAQRMVDVATIYLGFGILTADAALRHGAKSAGGFRSTRTTNRLGLVSPRAMAFALGVQCAARDLGRRDVKAIAAQMQPNPGAFVRHAYGWAAGNVDFGPRLALPDPDTWPPPPDVDALVGPLDDPDAHAEEERLDVDKGMRDVNVGLPVFRVERSMAGRLSKAAFMAIVFGGGMATRSNMGIDLQMAHVMIAAAIVAPSAYVIGRFFDDVRCSDPKCGVPLKPEMTHCPLCGGTIMGVIHHPKERLAAEEALAEREKVSVAAPPPEATDATRKSAPESGPSGS